MSPLLAKFFSTSGPLLAYRPKILLFLHWSSLIRQFGSSEVLWKSEGLDPGQNISKWIRTNFLLIENGYIFLSFCKEVCQNKHIVDPSLSKSCLLRTNCSEIHQVLISPVRLHLSSTFPLFLNLFVTFPIGSPLLIGENHTEMGFERMEFSNLAQWRKYSRLELAFPNFLNKILVFLPVQPVSLWHRKGFWSKDALLTCLHPEPVKYWGKVILLLLPCCLCFCGIVLTKNAYGARLPPPLS